MMRILVAVFCALGVAHVYKHRQMLNASKVLQFVEKDGSGTLDYQHMEACTEDMDAAHYNLPPLIKVVKYASMYIERGMSTSIYNIENLFHNISTAMASIVYFVTATLDVVLRSPVTVITTLLSLIQNILNGTVYILLDVILFCMEECLVFAIRAVMYILCSVIVNILTVISVAISLLSTTLVGYLTIIDFVILNFVFPVCDALFWMMIVCLTLVCLFCAFGSIEQSRERLERVWIRLGIKCVLILPVIYAATDIWRTACGILLKFVFHPLLYTGILGIVTFGIVMYVRFMLISSRSLFHEARNDTVYHVNIIFGYAKLYFRIKWIRLKHFVLANIIFTNIKNKLYVKTSIDGEHSSENDNLYNECVICFEEKEFVTIVPCLHSFICQSCISRVIEHDYRCPLCRGIIREVI
ncbi:uncharacterized protein LOC128214616 [Mya arenaria]|uniref:uncharacterized protein LOC128214616 n=1 Tax=Mya arenaria TaxID=6604 RepID=UPI0022E95348|nr:uncharacterized protein LOC128214616 [Mya arenaria]